MLTSLFESRSRGKLPRANRSPFASSYGQTTTLPQRQAYDSPESLSHGDEEEETYGASTESAQDDDTQDEDLDDAAHEEDGETLPLLPIFDSAHLDTLPVYFLTRTIRSMVVARCETVLTWEQLRSPQVSQFLLKPVQEEIQKHHFSAATIFCLMANCLQFTKESDMHPASSGMSQTRAMICELLAVKLSREYQTRELIDALSYDFDPLQGYAETSNTITPNYRSGWHPARKNLYRSPGISCMELAIRAQAKKFLSHPVVVLQLEAMWDGSIVFHAAGDSVYHPRERPQQATYDTNSDSDSQQLGKGIIHNIHTGTRKVVTLYNPRDASLFKLSRLRVPRYRNILSTLSFAILLTLYVAVLYHRSPYINALEIIFWFWATGFMIEEISGVSEQGFSLYIASFWNAIDLGILALFMAHLILRVVDLAQSGIDQTRMQRLAFDLLAADAILLFPRLFSILDHYKYFSQLIIAFRLMATDLAAVSVLIVIVCSGFFVALSLGFFGYSEKDDAYDIAYALLQIVMGYAPAVWDRWNVYPTLGRLILVSFLCLSHFMILTILITVLTNSFMAVVKNADEEHQFIFAVNAISSVKSDALFSYVPPLNVLGWLLYPLRYVLPFRQWVRINRFTIKITHFPILFVIWIYERTILRPHVVDSVDIVEVGRRAKSAFAEHFPSLARENSVANFRQDQALEEVFKQPFDAAIRTDSDHKRESGTAVNDWMYDMDKGDATTPRDDNRRASDTVQKKQYEGTKHSTSLRIRSPSQLRSVVSDPVDLAAHDYFSPQMRVTEYPSEGEVDSRNEADETGIRPLPLVDGLTRLPTPANRTSATGGQISSSSRSSQGSQSRHRNTHSGYESPSRSNTRKRQTSHTQTTSSATIANNAPEGEASEGDGTRFSTSVQSARNRRIEEALSKSTSSADNKIAKLKQPSESRSLFTTMNNTASRSVPDLTSDIEDKAIGGGHIGSVPGSFATQMAHAIGGLQEMQQQQKNEQQMLIRLMMARMDNLEEGFWDVIAEIRGDVKSSSKSRSPEHDAQSRKERKATEKDKRKGKENRHDYAGTSTGLDPKQSEITVIHDRPSRGTDALKARLSEMTAGDQSAVNATMGARGDGI